MATAEKSGMANRSVGDKRTMTHTHICTPSHHVQLGERIRSHLSDAATQLSVTKAKSNAR